MQPSRRKRLIGAFNTVFKSPRHPPPPPPPPCATWLELLKTACSQWVLLCVYISNYRSAFVLEVKLYMTELETYRYNADLAFSLVHEICSSSNRTCDVF